MKSILAIATLLVAVSVQAAWMTNYDEAIAASAQTGKPILADFTGSDWCIWCKRLDGEVFSKPEFRSFAEENLILLKLDFPRSGNQSAEEKAQNQRLAQRFDVQGFPTILLLNSQGAEIDRTGYRKGGAAAYVKHLKSML